MKYDILIVLEIRGQDEGTRTSTSGKGQRGGKGKDLVKVCFSHTTLALFSFLFIFVFIFKHFLFVLFIWCVCDFIFMFYVSVHGTTVLWKSCCVALFHSVQVVDHFGKINSFLICRGVKRKKK